MSSQMNNRNIGISSNLMMLSISNLTDRSDQVLIRESGQTVDQTVWPKVRRPALNKLIE